LRPLGGASRWLLLLFAPWLFTIAPTAASITQSSRRTNETARAVSAQIDPERAGLGTSAYVLLTIQQNTWREVAAALNALPYVEHFALVGGDFDVLAQLGSRIQHQLRAFTPDDAAALKATVRTFPTSPYDLEELLTSLGTGEAAVVVLSEKGVPTPVVHTRMRPPLSRMGPADDVAGAAKASELHAKYGTRLDSESAREMLAARLDPPAPGDAPPAKPTERQKGAGDAVGNGADAIGDFLKSSSGRALTREVVRGMFGMLKRGL
jgi:hypothetical protein